MLKFQRGFLLIISLISLACFITFICLLKSNVWSNWAVLLIPICIEICELLQLTVWCCITIGKDTE